MILSCLPFETFQGTGLMTGFRQIFVRFAGCSVKCPIRHCCDEQAALSPKGIFQDPQIFANNALLAMGTGGWVHVTGGEPCDQPRALEELCAACRSRGLKIHLQTSGTRRIPIRADYLTVSPKTIPDEIPGLCANEIVVVNDPSWVTDDILRGYERLASARYLCPLYIGAPEDLASNLPETIQRLARFPGWRLADQLHKRWGIK